MVSSASFDEVLRRIQDFSVGHHPTTQFYPFPDSFTARDPSPDSCPTRLDASLRLLPRQPSPPSPSALSQSTPLSHPTSSSSVSLGRNSFELFVSSRSKVIRIFNLPKDAIAALSNLFQPGGIHSPLSLWTLKPEYGGRHHGEEDSVWALFRTHQDARAALALSGTPISVATALESDLEPFNKLRRVELRRHSIAAFHVPPSNLPSNLPSMAHRQSTPPSSSNFADLARLGMPLRSTVSASDLYSRAAIDPGFTLSSNPPNPKTSFRQGDWICVSPTCQTHNFGRNLVCIGCGCRRLFSSIPAQPPAPPSSWLRTSQSPRFASLEDSPAFIPAAQQTKMPSILTPSGRAFSIGGRVQNISGDESNPVVIFWPDNEPLPDPGQVRPPLNYAAPPILNTGNRGPIEQQPGDWSCKKCDYLNWRRRRVCQQCYPLAEGNAEHLSSTAHAERISLLASVISAQQQPPPPLSHPRPLPQQHRPLALDSPMRQEFPPQAFPSPSPTLVRQRPSPSSDADYGSFTWSSASGTSSPFNKIPTPAAKQVDIPRTPSPLLPSFLQEIVGVPKKKKSNASLWSFDADLKGNGNAGVGNMSAWPSMLPSSHHIIYSSDRS